VKGRTAEFNDFAVLDYAIRIHMGEHRRVTKIDAIEATTCAPVARLIAAVALAWSMCA